MNRQNDPDLRRPNHDDLATLRGAIASAQALARDVTARVRITGRCTLALGGGSSPQSIYRALAELELPWDAITIVQTDERLGHEFPGHNWRTIQETGLLDRSRPRQRHLIRCNLPFDQARDAFETELRTLPGLDIAVLGVGPDGHVASLVGLQPDDRRDQALTRVSIHDGSHRITLSQTVLGRCGQRYVAVADDRRQTALLDALESCSEIGLATSGALAGGPTTLCLS